MAHAVALVFPPRAREPLDGGRIAAHAGTIFLNGLLLLALLAPLSQRIAQAPAEEDTITIVPLQKREPIEPPPPERVDIRPHPVRSMPTVPQPPSRAPAPVEAQVVDTLPGDIAISPPERVASDTASSLASIAPPAAAQLQALRSPPPAYPGEALRAGITGIVELEILVGVDGRPVDVRVVRSSGHRMLDQAALRTVRTKWTFVPAMRDGQPVQALGRVPVEFRMD